jgi:hypothetical protein
VFMHERPDCPIIRFKPTFGQFGDQATQGEGVFREPRCEPDFMFTLDCARPMPADLAGRNSTSFPETPHPIHRRADRYIKLRRCPMA